MKMTSAIANKYIRQLNEDKEFLEGKEISSSFYEAAEGEQPVIPEYDFEENNRAISEIDSKIAKIKHAINVHNAESSVDVSGKMMTVDEILISMAQFNRRKSFFDGMRKAQPKTRISSRGFGPKNTVPEYRYANYDIELAKAEFEKISRERMDMQLALDKFNQTDEFEVEM